ncbi:MAG: Protein-arginine kinase [Chlamydiae bacterium]|nr:Protein-arginine kinase [Chlamydiota bacterium]
MSEKSQIPEGFSENIPWASKEGAIWPVTAFILRRNLSHFPFPAKLQSNDAHGVVNSLKEAIEKEPLLEGSHFLPSDQLSLQDKQLIYEHFLFLRGFESPPDGAGFVLGPTGRFLASINGRDHLEMRALHTEGPLEETWNTLSHFETDLGHKVDFAFSPKFGYLTSDPGHCGTGLVLYAYLHVPALIHLEELENHLPLPGEDEIVAMSLAGNMVKIIGDIIVIQNNMTLGLTEESILHSVQSAATKIASAEKAAREKIQTEETASIKDLISKAFGLLLHSYQLETSEALDLLSLIKLGTALGWVTGAADQKLTALLFQCRQGHLARKFPDLSDPKEIAHKRAEFLHEELKALHLTPLLQ